MARTGHRRYHAGRGVLGRGGIFVERTSDGHVSFMNAPSYHGEVVRDSVLYDERVG